MKIKQEKQFTLPQLLEWAWDNDIRSRQIRADQDISAVFINKFGDVYITDDVKRDDTFTVTTEEEIDEDTHLDYLYMLTDTKDVLRCNYRTIKVATKAFKSYDFTFFTLVDNDLVKIYENGKMVE